jgi:nitrate/nitrite transporter NarK
MAAVGFAVINSLGNLSGFAAPFVVGAIKDATGSTAGGMQLIALYGCIAFVILAWLGRYYPRAALPREGAARVGEARG